MFNSGLLAIGPAIEEDRPQAPSGRRSCRRAALAVLVAPLLCAFDLPSIGIEGLGTPVADAQLAEMRGRFVSADQVSYFGLSLATSWQGADGVTTYATILFNVSFSQGINANGASPMMLIGWSRDCDGCADPTMDVVQFGPEALDGYVAIIPSGTSMNVGGLNTVRGAVQNQNIAGSDNRVRNDLSIAVVPISAIRELNSDGLVAATSGSTVNFADGNSVEFILGSNLVGLGLASGNGVNVVRQGIDGDLSQVAQHILIASNSNVIHNSIAITIGLDELRQADRLRVDNALSAMKGNGF